MGKHAALKNRPLIFIDVETTGLDPTQHEMIEVAAVVAYPDKNVETPVFEARIRPTHIETASPRALEVNGYSEKDWADARPMEEVLPELVAFLEGAVIGGQNTRFDVGFIHAALKHHGMDVRIDYHVIDVSTLAYEHLVPLGLKRLNLAAICEFIGVDPEPDVHRALNGAMKALEIYYALSKATWMDRLRWRLANL